MSYASKVVPRLGRSDVERIFVSQKDINDRISSAASTLPELKAKSLSEARRRVLQTESEVLSGNETGDSREWAARLGNWLRNNSPTEIDRNKAALTLSGWFTPSSDGALASERPYVLHQIYTGKPLVLYLLMTKGGDEASLNKSKQGYYKPDLGEIIWFKRMHAAGYETIRVYNEIRNVGRELNQNTSNPAYPQLLAGFLAGEPRLDIVPTVPCHRELVVEFGRLMYMHILPHLQSHGYHPDALEHFVGNHPSLEGLAERLAYNFRAILRYTGDHQTAFRAAARQTIIANSKKKNQTIEEGLYVSHAQYDGRIKVGWPFGGGYTPTHGVPVVYLSDGVPVFEIVPERELVYFKQNLAGSNATVYRVIDEKMNFLAYGVTMNGGKMVPDDVLQAVEYGITTSTRGTNKNATMGMSNVVLHLDGMPSEKLVPFVLALGIDNGHSPSIIANVAGNLLEHGVERGDVVRFVDAYTPDSTFQEKVASIIDQRKKKDPILIDNIRALQKEARA